MKKIQLKQVLRNKRFVLFTIILPIGWYIFFYQLQKGISPSILLGIAVFIGVIGNSLATFSKRIASDIGFYSFESRFTNYSVKHYLWDQSIVQLILNSLIFLAVLVVAVLGFHFPVTTSLLVQFFLLSLMGIYFSVIGFVLGVRVDAKTIDTIGFPVIILAAMTIIPFDTLGASGGFMDLVGNLQRAFPGYYYTKLIQDLTEKQTIDVSQLALFVAVFGLNLLFFYLLVPKGKMGN